MTRIRWYGVAALVLLAASVVSLQWPEPGVEQGTLEAARVASALSRTPKGIWANRVPSIEDYAADIPAEHAPALADFRKQFPGLDPTDLGDFNQAYMQEFTRHGDTLSEETAKLFNAWLEPMVGMQKAAVAARAKLVGVTLRGSEPIDPSGNSCSFVLAGFEGAAPRYYKTANAGAAESTGANLLRLNTSYDPQLAAPVDGTGLYVNVNDVGLTHEHAEFQLPDNGGSRIIYKTSYGTPDSHSTHVAGTIGCWGYNANLMGMAPRVWLRSFDSFYFNAGVTSHGMMWPGQNRGGGVQLASVVSNASIMAFDTGGGYSDDSRTTDSGLQSYPYLTYFFAAGNNSGFAKVASHQNASKNGVTIGAVADTVRDDFGNYVSGGGIASWSSRGPAYDGRIKPDLTANGTGLTSPNGTNSTRSLSGTSMASPNAAGSATVLIDYIKRKLPGHYFRSSTIKALLINTATDRGNPGPDYTYGYGIINVKAAADIVKRYAENPSTRVVLEDALSSGQTWTQTYTCDGTGPVRLSLCWVDPAGTASSDRSPRLVNDLNVRLIGPGGSTYEPFVMPFTTGNGTYAAYDSNLHNAAVVTGNNFTDNVEQILVATPPAGTYTVTVTHSGSLQNGDDQPFSLAVTGISGSTPIAPVLSSISPEAAPHVDVTPNNFIVTLGGSGFLLGSDVFLRRFSSTGTTEEAKGYGIIPVGNRIIARFDLAALSKGYWDVVVRTPDGTESILPNGFLIPTRAQRTILYANDFESGSTGLTLQGGWAVADPNKDSVSGPADAYQGTKALVTYPGANYPGSVQEKAQTPSFSTIGYIDIQVEFQQWLGVRPQDWAKIKSGVGLIRTHNSETDLIETGWSAQSFALDSFAENQSSFVIRFELSTDSTDHAFGWNIDDLKVTGRSTTTPVTYAPVFTSTAVTSVTPGEAYSYAITTTDADTPGTSLVLAATGLPNGLTFTPDGSGGATLSGTPLVTGIFPITISVTDGSYTTYQNFSITVNTAPDVSIVAPSTVTLSGGSSVPWTPADITTASWYDASDTGTITHSSGAVSQWRDKSGTNDLDVITGTPIYSATGWDGTRAAIEFNADSYLEQAVIKTYTDLTIIAVYDQDSTSALKRPFGIRDEDGTLNSETFAFESDNSLRYDGSNSPAVDVPASVGKHLRIASRSTTAQSDYVDGELNFSDTLTPTQTQGYINVGNTHCDLGAYFDGRIAEALIIDGTIDSTTRQKLEGYLAHKWGLAANLPTDHPYKAAAPMISTSAAVATLNGTVIDAEGDQYTTLWTVVGDAPGPVTFGDEYAEDTTATFTEVGTYTLQLTAIDEHGLPGYKNVTIIVTLDGGNPINDASLPAGISLYGYTGENPIDAQAAFQTLIDNSQLSLVRWVNPADGQIKELYYTTFPSAGWVNEIGDLTLGQGYVIKTTAACTLSIAGNKDTGSVSHDLPAGYSIIGFNRETPMDARTAVQPLIDADKLEVVRWVDPSSGQIKELYYTTFPSAGWVNEIGDLTEGQGYIIKLNTPHTGFSIQ